MARLTTPTGTLIMFTLVEGRLSELGPDGYAYRQPGIPVGASSTRAVVTHQSARPSELIGHILSNQFAELDGLAFELRQTVMGRVIYEDDFGRLTECLMHSAEPEIKRGRYAFGAASYTFRLTVHMTLEALT